MLQIRLEKEGIGKEKSDRVPPRPRQERPRQEPRRGAHDGRRPNIAPVGESRQIRVEPPLAKVGEDRVARLRLEPSNSLKFKIACSHKALQMAGGPMGGRGRGRGGRGRGGRGLRRSKTSPAAIGVGSLYAGLE